MLRGALVIAHVIAALAGAPANTSIHCTRHVPEREAGWAVVRDGTPTILLQPSTCRDLAGLRSRSILYGPIYFGEAVHIVAHEATHLTGVWDEYQAETHAQRITPGILRRVVRSISHGYDFRFLYRNAVYGSNAWHRALPVCYRRPVPCK